MKKFSVIIFLFINSFLSASETEISLHFKNEPLRNVLEHISNQTSFDFIFTDETIDNINITCSIDSQTVVDAVKKICSNIDVKVGLIKGNLIVLVKKITQPDPITLAGVVVDYQTGEVLPYVNLLVLETEQGTATDKFGRFNISDLPNEKLTIKVQHIGYSEFIFFADPDSIKKPIEISMSRSAVQIKDVIVIDSLQNIYHHTNRLSSMLIDKSTLEKLPHAGQKDLFRNIQLLPGVQASTGGFADIQIRGGTSSQNLIFLDGINLYHHDHFYGMYSIISPEIIKNVRIYKSCLDSKYGGKISGVIDVTTKNGSLSEMKTSVDLSNLGGGLYSEIPINSKSSLIVSARKLLWQNNLTDAYRTITLNRLDQFSDIEFYSNPEIDYEDYYVKWTYIPNNNNLFNLSFLSSDDKNIINFDQAETLDEYYDFFINAEELTYWKNRGFSFNWYYWNNKNFNASLNFAYSFYKSSHKLTENYSLIEDDSTSYSSGNEIYDYSTSLDFDYLISNKHKIKFGAQYKYVNLAMLNNDFGYSSDFRQDEKSNIFSFYFQNEIDLKSISFFAGIRGQYLVNSDNLFYEPRINLGLRLFSGMYFTASYNKNHQMIFDGENNNTSFNRVVNWVIADMDFFHPLTSSHYSAGLSWNIENYSVDAEYFYKSLNYFFSEYDVFENVDENAHLFLNNSDGLIRGFEIQAVKKSGSLTGWINYSYSNSSLVSFENISAASNYFKAHPHQVKVSANYEIGKFNFSSSYLFGTGGKIYYDSFYDDGYPEIEETFYYERESISMPNINRLDVAGTFSFDVKSLQLQIGLSVFNLFNFENIWKRIPYFEDADEKFYLDYKLSQRTFNFNVKVSY